MKVTTTVPGLGILTFGKSFDPDMPDTIATVWEAIAIYLAPRDKDSTYEYVMTSTGIYVSPTHFQVSVDIEANTPSPLTIRLISNQKGSVKLDSNPNEDPDFATEEQAQNFSWPYNSQPISVLQNWVFEALHQNWLSSSTEEVLFRAVKGSNTAHLELTFGWEYIEELDILKDPFKLLATIAKMLRPLERA